MKGKFQSLRENKSLGKVLISMCVYLASRGLIASHLAIYKQASLRSECEERGTLLLLLQMRNWRLGEGRAGRLLVLCRFRMKKANEEGRMNGPLSRPREGRTGRQYARRQLAFGCRVGLL